MRCVHLFKFMPSEAEEEVEWGISSCEFSSVLFICGYQTCSLCLWICMSSSQSASTVTVMHVLWIS